MSNEMLKAFYYGNLTPSDRQMIRGSESDRIARELSDAESLLAQVLFPEHKPALDRLVKAQGRLDSIVAEASYIDGFKTGARLIMEIMDDCRENLKPITG